MEGLVIVSAEADMHGARRENAFIALNGNGEYVGSLLIYPYIDHDIEPEHPHNLYLHLHAAQESGLSESVKDLLLAHALRRAAEIKCEQQQPRTRAYVMFLKGQEKGMAYFLQRGFEHDESMLILERDDASLPPDPRAPEGVSIRARAMTTEAEQHRFIETHQNVFPRHPYSTESLGELKSLPGWLNLTAFSDGVIAGNIMVYTRNDGGKARYIEDLFVTREWRRQGVARCLLHSALTHFHGAGIQRVQLEFWSANKPALSLYRAFGFSAVDETEIAVGRYV